MFVHYLPIEHITISKDDKLLIVVTKNSCILGFDFQKFGCFYNFRLLGTNSDTMPLHSAESFEGFLLFHKIHLFASENPNVRVTDVHIGFGQWHDAVLYVATSDSSCMVRLSVNFSYLIVYLVIHLPR